MREVRDPARADDPIRRRGEVAPLALELGRVALDPDAEHVPVVVLREHAVELDAWEDDQLGRRGRDAPVPVIGEGDDVVSGAGVVPRDRARGQLSVRVRRMHVERRPQPLSLGSPRRFHGRDPIARPSCAAYDRPARHHDPREMPVDDFQEQEYEFLRRLEEERIGRSTLLKRGLAAAAGLTVIALPEAALAARQKALANPPIRGTKKNLAQLVAAAKKEGHLNVIALPPDWANYGEIISTFTKKYGIPITSDNPNGSSSEENQAVVSLKGDPRAPDVVDVNPTFAVAGTVAGLYSRYFVRNYASVPRSMKDTRGFWTGDYYGSVTIGYNANLVKTPPKSFADLLKPIYKNQVALNGSPLTSGSAIAGVFAAALVQRRLALERQPGDRLVREGAIGRQLHPGADDAADGGVGPDADLDRLGLQQLRVREGVPVGLEGRHPVRRAVRRLLLPGGQRHRATPVGGTPVAGVHLLRPGTDPVPEGVRASRAFRRPRRAQGDPEVGDERIARRLAQCKGGEVREPRPAEQGEGGHQHGVAGQARLELVHWQRKRQPKTFSGRAPSPAGDSRSPGSASCRSSPTPRCS